MKKIATHDSATGEAGCGLLSYIMTPFTRTQSKTIKEQYEAGCRSFDIRIRKSDGVWKCAHGPWTTKRTAEDIISEIDLFLEPCQVCVVYEGKWDDGFEDFALSLKSRYPNIIWGYIATKFSEGHTLAKYNILKGSDPGYEGGKQGFLPLDGRSWHTYLPIPWLWKKIYHNHPTFNEDTFTYVDFL